MRRLRSLPFAILLIASLALVPARADSLREDDVAFVMDDGIRLSGHRWLPIDRCPCPTVIGFNPYGTNGPALTGIGTDTSRGPFLAAGYAVTVVDVRGTGQSEGIWGILNTRERRDYADVIRQVAREEWSDGSVVTFGGSYGGITGLLAAQEPDLEPLKAVFASVPYADAYRDILSSGGSSNVEFLGVWSLGLVGGPSVLQPLVALQRDPQIAINATTAHALGLVNVAKANVGFNTGEDHDPVLGAPDPEDPGSAPSFDGEYYNIRSVIDGIDRVRIPVFIVGAELDIFQRSEPLLYNALPLPPEKKKLLLTPGYHTQTRNAAGKIDDHGETIPTLTDLAVGWFDRWARGIDNGIDARPPIQRWFYGADTFVRQQSDPPGRMGYERWYLDGADLTRTVPQTEGTRAIVFQPFENSCSRTSIQYLFGTVPDMQCSTASPMPETEGATFTSPPFDASYVLAGPMSMHVWFRSTRSDTNVVAIVSDVAPDGAVTSYSYGAQVASLRAVDATPCAGSVVDGCSEHGEPGELIRPWHPFTQASQQKLEPSAVYDMWVEINPVSLVLQPGHRLRVTLKAGDFPHTVTNTSVLRDSAGGVTEVLTGPGTPSYLYVGHVPGGLAALKEEFDAGR